MLLNRCIEPDPHFAILSFFNDQRDKLEERLGKDVYIHILDNKELNALDVMKRDLHEKGSASSFYQELIDDYFSA